MKTTELNVSSVCSICNNTHIKLEYVGILKCQKCGHVFSDLYLKDKEFFKIYNKDYFFGGEYHNYLADKKILQKNFKSRLKILQTFIKPTRHKHLLEIGSAYGFFLDIAKDKFITLQGIDITKDGTLYAREELKLNVINNSFLKTDFGNKKYDVVCMWDTVEHLEQPHLYFEKLSNHMAAGALIAITTGDIGSLNARIRKDKWRLIRTPTHIHFFSKKTMTRMLNKYGFDVIYNHYCGFYRSIDFIAYRMLVLKNRWPWIYNFLHSNKVTNINFYLNLYDVMYVIARKR